MLYIETCFIKLKIMLEICNSFRNHDTVDIQNCSSKMRTAVTLDVKFTSKETRRNRKDILVHYVLYLIYEIYQKRITK